MKKKRETLIIFIFLCSILSVFSSPQKIHNQDIAQTIFGIPDWKTMKLQNETIKKQYYVVTNATYLSVDYNGTKNGAAKYLKEINNNLADLNKNPLEIPQEMNMKLGGGAHRSYNHRGFYASDYETKNQIARLNAGKQLSLNAASAALNLGKDAGELISIAGYYTHYTGDLTKGAERSIQKMGATSTPDGLFATLEKDLKEYLDNPHDSVSTAVAKKALRDASHQKKIFSRKVQEQPQNINSLRKEASQEMKQLIGKDLSIRAINETARRQNRLMLIRSYGKAASLGAVSAGMGYLMTALVYKNFSWSELGQRVAFGTAVGAGLQFATFPASRIAERVVQRMSAGQLGKTVAKATTRKGLGTFAKVGGLEIITDSIFDIFKYGNMYRNGVLTSTQAIRNGTISIGINVVTGIGINVASTAITAALAGTTVAGPVGFVVAVAGVGIYTATNIFVENVTKYFNIQDIRKCLNDPYQIRKWTTAYLSSETLYY